MISLESIIKGVDKFKDIHDISDNLIFTALVPQGFEIDSRFDTSVPPLDSPIHLMRYGGVFRSATLVIHLYTAYLADDVDMILQHNPFEIPYDLQATVSKGELDSTYQHPYDTPLYTKREYIPPTILFKKEVK